MTSLTSPAFALPLLPLSAASGAAVPDWSPLFFLERSSAAAGEDEDEDEDEDEASDLLSFASVLTFDCALSTFGSFFTSVCACTTSLASTKTLSKAFIALELLAAADAFGMLFLAPSWAASSVSE